MNPSFHATLAAELAGTAMTAAVLDVEGVPLADPHRIALRRALEPEAFIDLLLAASEQQPGFDRVSVGFPGVVIDNVITSSQLEGSWSSCPLGRMIEVRTERMTRVVSNTDLRGYGVIRGEGVELVLTLGRGLGSALFIDGKLIPNLQLGLQTYKKKSSYSDHVGEVALAGVGAKRWTKRVWHLVDLIRPVFNPSRIYITGEKARRLKGDAPPDVKVLKRTDLTGGVRIWDVSPLG